MISGIILSYQTLTGCKLEYLPTDSPEEPNKKLIAIMYFIYLTSFEHFGMLSHTDKSSVMFIKVYRYPETIKEDVS